MNAERMILAAVTRADMVVIDVCAALRCLAVGAFAGWLTWAAWGLVGLRQRRRRDT